MNKIGQITLRLAGPEDAPTLLSLMRAAFEEYEGVPDPPSGAHQESVDTVGRSIARGGAVVASIADQPVGFAFFRPDDGLLYFGRLSVLPQFRNKGIGGALLDYVERLAPTWVYMEKDFSL